jgi:hypothetical protein
MICHRLKKVSDRNRGPAIRRLGYERFANIAVT